MNAVIRFFDQLLRRFEVQRLRRILIENLVDCITKSEAEHWAAAGLLERQSLSRRIDELGARIARLEDEGRQP